MLLALVLKTEASHLEALLDSVVAKLPLTDGTLVSIVGLLVILGTWGYAPLIWNIIGCYGHSD